MDIAIVVEMSTTGMISLYPSRKYHQHNVIFSSRAETRIGRAWDQDNKKKKMKKITSATYELMERRKAN